MLSHEEHMILNVEDACKRILAKTSGSTRPLGHADYSAILVRAKNARMCSTAVAPPS